MVWYPMMSHGCLAFWLLVAVLPARSQVLDLPPRPANAPDGTQFTNIITTLPRAERENWIHSQIVSGNVPGWLRTLRPISVTGGGHTATYYVTPDYLAVGSDTDYFLVPMTPLLAQRLCDRLGCSLPTRRMVNQIWTNAALKLSPLTIPPSPEMITVPVFAQHNAMVRAQRHAATNAYPLGALVGGDKKDVIISARIYTNFANPGITKPVVIYGWHYTSGTPIQPLYNGHEETYADYSHGIRLVQMSLTVDGSPNTVTNVLTNPSLAPLLSDDGPAEGSPNGTLPVPRYTVAPQAPVILSHPRSQSALPGSGLTLEVLAIGDGPLEYQWRRNGVAAPGSTGTIHSITNFSSVEAGDWSVVITNPAGSATSRVAVVRLRTSDFPTVFTDDFGMDTGTNWNVFWGASNGIPDYSVDFAYDHGVTPYTFNGVTALIPPAPNSVDGSTRAVRLAVNQDLTGALAAVNLYPVNLAVGGDVALKFDLWINYPGNALGGNSTGSTQHAQCGINHLGTNVNWATTSVPASDGLWFAVSGEGGDSRDYRSYVGNLAGSPVDLTGSPASGLVGTNHTAAVFQALFPGSRFETAGAPGKNWVEVELRQVRGILTWLMNGTVIASRANTSGFTNGTVMLGLMDVFSSVANPARDSFVLFDNVRVEDLAPPIRFQSLARQPNGEVVLEMTSALGDSYWLDASADLTGWLPLAQVSATEQPAAFTDTNAAAGALRFYRARR